MLKVRYKQTNLGTTVLCVTGDVIHSNMAWNLEQTLMISEKNTLIIKKKNTKWDTSGRRHKLCVCKKRPWQVKNRNILLWILLTVYKMYCSPQESQTVEIPLAPCLFPAYVAVVSLGGVWRSTGDAAPLVWTPPPSSSARGAGVVIVR